MRWFPVDADRLQSLAREAGAAILHVKETGTLDTAHKGDGSPVTLADKASQKIILDGLTQLTPDIPIVSEEKDNPASLSSTGTYWLVDPLDGTRDFVEGGSEFSVSIGLIVNHEPYLGVIYVPVRNELFYGDPFSAFRFQGTTKTSLRHKTVTERPASEASLITSRREKKKTPIAKMLDDGQIGTWQECSSAYKFGLLAAGEADIFLRTGPTCEWDTAAGDALLRSVGGRVVTPDNAPLAYGKKDFLNPGFLAHTRNVTPREMDRFIDILRSNQPHI